MRLFDIIKKGDHIYIKNEQRESYVDCAECNGSGVASAKLCRSGEKIAILCPKCEGKGKVLKEGGYTLSDLEFLAYNKEYDNYVFKLIYSDYDFFYTLTFSESYFTDKDTNAYIKAQINNKEVYVLLSSLLNSEINN